MSRRSRVRACWCVNRSLTVCSDYLWWVNALFLLFKYAGHFIDGTVIRRAIFVAKGQLFSTDFRIFDGSCSNATEPHLAVYCAKSERKTENILLIFWFVFLLFALFCAVFVKMKFFIRLLFASFEIIINFLVFFFLLWLLLEPTTAVTASNLHIHTSSLSIVWRVLNCSEFIVRIHV